MRGKVGEFNPDALLAAPNNFPREFQGFLVGRHRKGYDDILTSEEIIRGFNKRAASADIQDAAFKGPALYLIVSRYQAAFARLAAAIFLVFY